MQDRIRPTIFDVASRAGVSPATVSRVLSHPAIVRPEKRVRVNAAILALGYVRDGTARALVSGNTGAVGVVVPTLDNAIFSRAIQALQSRLAEAGYRLLVASHEYSTTTEAAAARSLIEHGIDAMVLVGIDHAPELWTLIDNAPIPLVLTWSIAAGRDCVGFDNRRAGRIAAEHLLALGHRSFGIISGILQHNDRATARIAGVRDALAEVGLGIPDRRISQQSFTLAGGRAGLATLLTPDDGPTAIIGGNDLLAAGALFEAQARGIRVPDQLSIIGIDNLELSEHVTPALSTVHLPTAALGWHAAELVLARLEGDRAPRAIELPIDLIVRQSTGPVPPAALRTET
jgi:LacI family transcriptional regulator